jgi:hypothetical protein
MRFLDPDLEAYLDELADAAPALKRQGAIIRACFTDEPLNDERRPDADRTALLPTNALSSLSAGMGQGQSVEGDQPPWPESTGSSGNRAGVTTTG